MLDLKYTTKRKIILIIVIIFIAICCGMYYLVSTMNFKFTDIGAVAKEYSQDLSSSTSDAQNTSRSELLILDDNSDEDYKFNTVFGGTDYSREVSEYWESVGVSESEYSKIYDALNSFDINSIEDELIHEQTSVESKYDVLYFSDDASKFTAELLTSKQGLLIESGVVCIGVANDYYSIYWLEGTDYIFIEDNSTSVYSKDYFIRQLDHIGKDCSIALEKKYIKVENKNDYTFVFIGAQGGSVDETESQ